MEIKKFFYLIILSLNLNYFCCELFTALADLSQVFQAEKELSLILSQFVEDEEKRLEKIIQFSKELKSNNITINDLADSSEIEKYFSNPINSYLFTRKFAYDWKENLNLVNDFINNKFRILLLEEIGKFHHRLPVEEDIHGAIDALIRLQETYHLKTKDLVDGKIQNFQSNVQLNANDCFKIGLHAYSKENYLVAAKWFKESLNLLKINKVDAKNKVDEKLIIDYLSYCLGSIGLYRAALNYTNDLLQLGVYENRERLLENKLFFQGKIAEEVIPNYNEDPDFLIHQDGNIYAALCRGENPIYFERNDFDLKCHHIVPHLYFLIGPLKIEVVFNEPRIIVFHDIIHDDEIEHIKETATPNLNRATVRNPKTGVLEYASYRISKSAWLPNTLDEVTIKLNNRITAATGLSIETAEDLQVVNYGIGGHYSPHFDHGTKRPQDAFEIERGNRIATMLFYLSDVEAGGATVFTEIGAALWPKKGSAAFWYNLKQNGDGDDNTRHAACPVLVGSKWVMNKWFRERGQEFRRPCKTENI